MEELIDAIVRELDLIKDLDYPEGFKDEIDLADNVWFGNPGILAAQQYPYIYVEPETGVPKSETTGHMTRTLNVRIVLLIDPRQFYEEAEIVEQTASREMIRTMEAIEQHFEKTSLRKPNGLANGVQGYILGTTEYAQQIRGSLYSLGASIVLNVDKRRPRLD